MYKFFFFFKQKTAYEIMPSLVGSEMCIRDSDWEPENENQMLAVWGSPGSGKTTTAVKLAARLAMQKKDVALLLCDMNTPMLPCICPPGDLDEEHSLGSVLAATHVLSLIHICRCRRSTLWRSRWSSYQ